MSDQQCEHSGPQGQCHNDRVDGSRFCSRHSSEAERIRGYRIANPELRKAVEYHSQSASFDTVRDEIVLLKGIIEDRLSMGNTEAERIGAYQSVTPTVISLVKCYETLSKLERQTSVVLGKEALTFLQKEIIEILTSELKNTPDYESVVDRIANRIASAISEARNKE